MKKIWTLLAVTMVLTALLGATASAAGSASATITNKTSVQPGESCTYTISVKITSSMDFIGTIKFSGIFSHDPIYLDYHPSSNSSTTLTNKVTLKVPAGAKVGDVGQITVTGQGAYLDADSNPVEYSVSKTLSAKVAAPAATKSPSATKDASKETKKPAATKTPKASAPTPSPTPTATPVPSEWDLAVQSAAALDAGGTLRVDVVQSAKVPVSLLSAIKDKQGKLTVNLSGYACTIDGAALGRIPEVESIDLAMTADKDPALTAAAAGADLRQLHFAGSGQFPGRFAYTFQAEASKPGDTLYLYRYYDQSGVLEGIQSAVVDDGGTVTFDIYDCSAYLVAGSVIPGAAGTLAAVNESREAQARLADMQAQLDEARNSAVQLQEQMGQRDGQLKEAQDQASAQQSALQGKLCVTPVQLAAAAGALALVTALLTALLCRAGRSRKRGKHASGNPGDAGGDR